MTLIERSATQLTRSNFERDAHAARYLAALEADSDSFHALLDLLNDPVSVHLMEHESESGNAALRGVVRAMAADAEIWRAVSDPSAGPRFRQAVGVAIRLKMELQGWITSGRKGPVRTEPFTRAEKYQRPSDPTFSSSARALATLDRVASIGTDDERRSTGERLDAALRVTRGEAGRPY